MPRAWHVINILWSSLSDEAFVRISEFLCWTWLSLTHTYTLQIGILRKSLHDILSLVMINLGRKRQFRNPKYIIKMWLRLVDFAWLKGSECFLYEFARTGTPPVIQIRNVRGCPDKCIRMEMLVQRRLFMKKSPLNKKADLFPCVLSAKF